MRLTMTLLAIALAVTMALTAGVAIRSTMTEYLQTVASVTE